MKLQLIIQIEFVCLPCNIYLFIYFLKFSRHPDIKWAQRKDVVFITILLIDSKDEKVTLDPEGVLSYSATAGLDNNAYELKLELFDKVNVEVINFFEMYINH